MDNQQIHENALEQYEDAAIALFLEHYADALSENLHSGMDENGKEDIVFPEKLDNRCRALIKKEHSRKRQKQRLKNVARGLRYAAAFAVILLSLFSILYMTVDAIRIPVVNYFIEQGDGYWKIFSKKESDQKPYNKVMNPADPLAGLIPKTYRLVLQEGDSLAYLTAIYEDDAGNQIFFSAVPSDSFTIIDSEGAQISQTFQLKGCDGILVVEDKFVRLAWIHKESSTTFTLIADGIDEQYVISIAEWFMDIILEA